MTEPVTLSGRGSKVLEVDLPQGRYRLSWQAHAKDEELNASHLDWTISFTPL